MPCYMIFSCSYYQDQLGFALQAHGIIARYNAMHHANISHRVKVLNMLNANVTAVQRRLPVSLAIPSIFYLCIKLCLAADS